ncbi:MAG: T9SS type A sorting domain-containing protein [Bacteroidota bacterium]
MTPSATRWQSFCYLLCLFFTGLTPTIAQSDFTAYPWLNELIDTEDCCQNQKVIAYQVGIFTYVYIEKDETCSDESGTLYFQDGTLYCMDAVGLDCRAAYGLTEEGARVLYDCQANQAVDEIYVVCAGEALLLPAVQTFPQPPQGPTGPNGELPTTPCTPLLSSISISPTAGATPKDLEGFIIFPTSEGIYEVTSNGVCGGPGTGNSDQITVRYQVLLDEECEVEVSCVNVLEQDWIVPLLREECTGKIYQVEYEGQEAIYITTLCGCVDAVDVLYDCAGTTICTLGGNVDPDSEGICDATIRTQLIDDNAIWKPECDCPCPVDRNPVCGVDGLTYESACHAFCLGVAIADDQPCEESTCARLTSLNINEEFCNTCFSEVSIYRYEGTDYLVTREDNPICSDGITTVTNCDSSIAFCFDGGIAGFDQCGDFFAEATLVETIWSRKEDCNKEEVEFADPCTDLAEVDFGLCEAVMGIGRVNGKCITISGCLSFEINGVDYSNAFFPTVELCEQACSNNESEAAIFEEFSWLSEVVDRENCAGTTIEVYDLTAFKYVHVATEEGSALYFEDGTFYCMDLPNYDCRGLYGLTEAQISDIYTCPSGPISPIGGGRWRSSSPSFPNYSPTLRAFPNPTNGLVQVQLPSDEVDTNARLRVFDVYGRLINEVTVSGLAATVDLTREEAGIYVVEWQLGTEQQVVKVLKQ